MSKLLFPLSEADDIMLVGGKGHSLGKMIKAGFNVPEGFVVSASVFSEMTTSLEKDIKQAFNALRANLVAVRSSAINEDGKDAAWAGQLDTFLNTDQATLIVNIRKCWDSAQSARAQAYAQQKSIETGKVAVVVQKMIQSQVSGVAFSVHPILQDTSKIIIEAGLGLGEAIVSGQITPDTYITSKQSGEVLEKHIAKQTKQLAQNNAGQTGWGDVGAEGANQKLTDRQVTVLSNIVTKLEDYFGFPVDVEWGLYDDKFYILQSRPITNLTN